MRRCEIMKSHASPTMTLAYSAISNVSSSDHICNHIAIGEGGGGILSSPFCFSLLGSWNSAVFQIVLLLMLIDHRRSGRQLDAVAAAHLRAFGRWFAMGHC